MTVRFKCWSEDGEEVINVPKSQLISEFAPHTTLPAVPKQAKDVEEKAVKWTMPDDPDRFGDYA
jgi:hypothetical protein